MSKLKIIIFTNIITPYRIPLFNYLNSIKNINLKVLALSESEKNREWKINENRIKFNNEIVPGYHTFISSIGIPIHFNWGLWQILKEEEPDIVITSGYNNLAFWEAFLYCKIHKVDNILWSGTTMLSSRTEKGILNWIKKIIIKEADRYIAYGTKAAEYLEYMGVKRGLIQVGVNTVDMAWFKNEVKKIRSLESFRRRRSKYPEFLFLYVGRLIESKGITKIINCLNKFNNRRVGLLIIGSGPQEQKLKEITQSLKLKYIYFKGFKQKSELPYYYAISDVLIFPTLREVWGLVVNEALASGLYVLCSDRAGAAYDLIKEDWNGNKFNPNDTEELISLLETTIKRIDVIRKRRNSISVQACREFNIDSYAVAFYNAIFGIVE